MVNIKIKPNLKLQYYVSDTKETLILGNQLNFF